MLWYTKYFDFFFTLTDNTDLIVVSAGNVDSQMLHKMEMYLGTFEKL